MTLAEFAPRSSRGEGTCQARCSESSSSQRLPLARDLEVFSPLSRTARRCDARRKDHPVKCACGCCQEQMTPTDLVHKFDVL